MLQLRNAVSKDDTSRSVMGWGHCPEYHGFGVCPVRITVRRCGWKLEGIASDQRHNTFANRKFQRAFYHIAALLTPVGVKLIAGTGPGGEGGDDHFQCPGKGWADQFIFHAAFKPQGATLMSAHNAVGLRVVGGFRIGKEPVDANAKSRAVDQFVVKAQALMARPVYNSSAARP